MSMCTALMFWILSKQLVWQQSFFSTQTEFWVKKTINSVREATFVTEFLLRSLEAADVVLSSRDSNPVL